MIPRIIHIETENGDVVTFLIEAGKEAVLLPPGVSVELSDGTILGDTEPRAVEGAEH